MALIRLKKISKIYQQNKEVEPFKALDEIDLEIEKGEYVAIVGPSGSGKSTLLQILGLLDISSSGQYFFDEQDVSILSDDELTALRSKTIGFIFQMFNLLPRISSVENAALPMIYSGQKDIEKVKKILTQLGLENHFINTPAQLSGGQQQRVAIARSLVNSPQVVFADEPTGNLPQKQAVEIIAELERMHQTGITLVIITHSNELAKRADRIIKIVDGKIVEDSKGYKKQDIKTQNIENKNSVRTSKKINPNLWLQVTKMSLQSLLRNKVRTFLTMLGIIIGVFSVTSMLAIGDGAKKSVEEELKQMGSNMFRVSTEWPKVKGSQSHKRTITKLNPSDLKSIENAAKKSINIKYAAGTRDVEGVISYNGYSYTSKLMGVSASFQKMRNLKVRYGRFFTDSENSKQAKVCVLGDTVYSSIFKKGVNPIGKSIDINGSKYRVIGLLPKKGSSFTGDIDDVVYLPEQTVINRIYGRKQYRHLFVEATSTENIEAAMFEVTKILRQNHRLPDEVENDFEIKNFGEIRSTIDSISKNFLILIIVIALISLIVGGIGIMNIMLVSVTERTREIGLRKAVGARKSDILNQFLIESILISMLGGFIGVTGAFFVGTIVEYLFSWEIVFRAYMIILAFGFSMCVGVFFGWYPAKKAANLSPIQALRYE
ncbi:MAG TPA: ABC transporter permease [Oligoflexia bacterium]|nr:ABC transporter permease [Oligoflexia bacterium]HMR23816.1 ABC transporter permease [Oligoflexia bacterium]